ncbi:hypothetical protein FSP39_005842 [Pinctada imbricata]|uniref:BZIP domain-containing protein n=1 Tax=Pinctada imbricata TaxID=66713 RepID=A0AA89C308_PINIB|nr:hypothetical protein FSP39_005842 [Pinctada imbricata]
MADAALDLSAKPVLELEKPIRLPTTSSLGSDRSSPVSSIHSDGNESDNSNNSIKHGRERTRIPSSSQLMSSTEHSSTSVKSEDDVPGSSDLHSALSVSRPFKMYPMDPFSLYSMATTPTSPLSPPGTSTAPLGVPSVYENPAFPSFPLTPLTSHLLQRKRRSDSRPEAADNKKTKPVPEEKKDESYWERRRKNNEAAKRSRDARRHKEEEIAMRAAFLEQENLKLRAQVAILKNETAKLHYMLYNRI